MISPAIFFPTVSFALLFAPTTSGKSWHHEFNPATHRIHHIGPHKSLEFQTFHPESTFEGFGVEGGDPYPSDRRYHRDTRTPGDVVVSFLASKLNIPEEDIHLRTNARVQAAHHFFLSQKIRGLPVANAVANVAFNNKGRISSYSSSFVQFTGATDNVPSVSLDHAIVTAEKMVGGVYTEHPTTLEYIVKPNGYAVLTYGIQIRNQTARTWYEAFIDAHDNELVSVTDFVAKASYIALPIQASNPSQGFKTIKNPQDMVASPSGWHQEFTMAYTVTQGNNAVAFQGLQLITLATQTSANLNFDYVANLRKDPTTGDNVPAAITNAFYVVNTYHDIAYRYGFTETTFNFQTNNFNKGGQGFDRVLVRVQDTSGTNGADMTVLPDGQSPTLAMYLFTGFKPQRDSALQNDLLIHECQHGATHRMTGGGTARCYQTVEASAVSEGLADAMADAMSQVLNTVDYVFGSGVSKSRTGLRSSTYSTNNVTNPLRYSDLRGEYDPYRMGEVLANILHNVYAALVAAHGWSSRAFTDPTTMEGNVVFYHLFFDALLLMPCPPTFHSTRDAWIQADANRYGGANKCVLWQVFASRGLGTLATKSYTDDMTIPPECLC